MSFFIALVQICGCRRRDLWRFAVESAAALLGRNEQIKRLEEALAEQRATLQAKDERIAGLAAAATQQRFASGKNRWRKHNSTT